ncbi:MAG: hypothetical protein ACRDQY_21190 [Pseudonocardiaceae bacterium]
MTLCDELPARDNDYAPIVRGYERRTGRAKVVVIDDASTDNSARLALNHPLRPTVLSLPQRLGSGAAPQHRHTRG